jgi:hypothetical protein
MNGSEEDTIGGFNSYIEKNKNSNYKITTILFDDRYEVLYESKPIKDVKKLTSKEYYTRGSTALLDAIGRSISLMDQKNSNKSLFIITTDGYENASREYNKESIKKLIKNHKKYEFMYIGADIDSYNEGASLGIKKDNISNYVKDKRGIGMLFEAVSCASKKVMKNESLDCSWKEELEGYINSNKES